MNSPIIDSYCDGFAFLSWRRSFELSTADNPPGALSMASLIASRISGVTSLFAMASSQFFCGSLWSVVKLRGGVRPNTPPHHQESELFGTFRTDSGLDALGDGQHSSASSAPSGVLCRVSGWEGLPSPHNAVQ